MTAVQNGQYDATLQDLPAALFYRERFPGLELVGPPESHGYYVSTCARKTLAPRRHRPALARLIESGELRRLYERYGIWTEAQEELVDIHGAARARGSAGERRRLGPRDRYRSRLIDAAIVTDRLSRHVDAAGDGARPLDRAGKALRPAPLRPLLQATSS